VAPLIASRRARVLAFLGLGLLAFIIVPSAIQLTADWFWFQEIGFESVFTRELSTKLGLFVVVAILALSVILGNLRFAQRGIVVSPVLLRLDPNLPGVDVTAGIRRIATPVAFALAAVLALSAVGGWLIVLQFLDRVPFGVTDPVFARDVGYYVFTLPAISMILGILMALTVLSLLICAPIYWLRGDLVLPPRRAVVEPSAGWHLGILLASFAALTALQIWFVRIPELLYSTTGPLVGASYADINASLPAMRVMAFIAAIGAVVVIVGAARGKLIWHTAIAAGLYLAVSILGAGVYPSIIQRFVVAPTELTLESPYIANHINATRQAWGLNAVEVRDLSGDDRLTADDIRANGPTIENVRLWDRDPLLQTFGQLQEIRTYYDFVSVDDDRYWIDGKYRQVLMSPRELSAGSLPTRNFINEHLTFTHGMGVTLAPVNQVTIEGLPVLFVKDLPPVSTVSIEVTRPQIYYGELTDHIVFVGTKQREFDFPSGEENVYRAYTGTGGVRVGSMLRRGILAARFGSKDVLLSGDITSESRVLYHRSIRDRATKALPFLRFDADPYMVINEAGELKWMMDAYTASTRYPYSQRLTDGTSYMRNSVKVIIDAYHGSVDAYIVDPNDPIIATLDKVFPGIMQPMDNMPADMRAHIRYAEDLYRVQAALHTTYHMTDPQIFYNREDQWQIPMLPQGQRQDPFMRRIIMRLPDEPEPEFIFMTPFTPRGKDNLAAWMVARSDGENYGTLRVYRFPKQSLVFGPQQIVNRINQDTEIARQISLWSQGGSTVIRGELLVIPIEESLLYVQPLYLRAEGGRIPELKRVIIAYQNRVVMEETLDEGLGRLFGAAGIAARPVGAAPAGTVAGGATPGAVDPADPTATVRTPTQVDDPRRAELTRSLQQAYDRAVAAQRAGDWATYGTEIERLGTIIRQLNALGGG
jgi:uncharacterized protein